MRPERADSFSIDRAGRLVREAVPSRGEPYQHTCERDVFEEIAHLCDELDWFTLERLVERSGVPSSQAATALAFLKERGCVVTEARRCYAASGSVHLDAMIELCALSGG